MYYAVTCSICKKPVTVTASSEKEAKQFLAGMIVCPAGLHPSFPNVLVNSTDFRKVGWFGFFHSGK